MRVKVAKWGNSIAVRLPRAAASALKALPGSELELTLRGGRVELHQPTAIPAYRLEDLVTEMAAIPQTERPAFEDWGILPSEWPDEDWSDVAPSDEEMGIGDAGARPRNT